MGHASCRLIRIRTACKIFQSRLTLDPDSHVHFNMYACSFECYSTVLHNTYVCTIQHACVYATSKAAHWETAHDQDHTSRWWGSGSWSGWHGYQWGGSWGHEWDSWKSWNAPESRVEGLLQRGHTVDRLSEAELQEVVAQIDSIRESMKRGSEAEQPASKRADNAETKDEKKNPEGKEAKESEPQQEQEAAAKQEDAKPAAADNKKETKEERRKRLHARNMRYYRSFASYLPILATIGFQFFATCGSAEVRRAQKKSRSCMIELRGTVLRNLSCSKIGC